MIGYVILAIWLTSLIVTGLWLILHYKGQVSGTRLQDLDVIVRYEPYAEEWTDLADYLSKLRGLLFKRYSASQVTDALSFNLVVLPFNKPVITKEIPKGYVTDAQGKRLQVTGSMEIKRFFFGLVKRKFIYARQNEFAPNEIKRSALLHEILEHVLPYVLTGDSNAAHAKSWVTLENEINIQL